MAWGQRPSGDSHAFDAMGMFLARDGGVVDSICSSSALSLIHI